VIPGFVDIEVVAYARSKGNNHIADLGVLKDLVQPGSLHIEYLSPQRQYGLKMAVSALLGAAPGRLALHYVYLAFAGVTIGAVGQLSRQASRAEGILAAGKLLGLPRCLPCSQCLSRLLHYGGGHNGVLLEVLGEPLRDHGLYQPPDGAVAQAGLGLTLELGIGKLHADDGHQPLPQVFPAQLGLRLEDLIGPGVFVDRLGQSGPKSHEMSAALPGVDIVGIGIDILIVGVVVLQGHLHCRPVLGAGEV